MNEQQLAAVKQALEALEKLWGIIDDIDTYGDMAKADEKLYRTLVERRQRQRFEETGISTDGYELHGGAITAIKQAIAQDALDKKAENARELGLDYDTPPKAQTEAEKTAYAFGWCKAMEYVRQNGVITSKPVPVKTYSGGKAWPVQTEWVGLTDDELNEWTPEIHAVILAIQAKLQEKNSKG